MLGYMKKGGKYLSFLLILSMLFSLVFTVAWADSNEYDHADIVRHVYQNVDIEGEEADLFVMGHKKVALMESASSIDVLNGTVVYYRNHNTTLTSWWELVALRGAGENLLDGSWILPQWESSNLQVSAPATDYAGYILGMLARNEDPAQVWGERNLLQELGEKQADNGSFGLINEHIWAMIALDAADGSYNQTIAAQHLVDNQKPDGGFALSGSTGDPDVTGMALVALSSHRSINGVEGSIQQAVDYLKGSQLDTAGFASWGTDNSNSLATVITGLVAVGEDVLSDDWIKDGTTVLDSLLRFQLADGSFSFQVDPKTQNSMATNQALIALGDLVAGETVFKRLDAPAAAKTVHLRVEGINQNVFDGTVEVVSAGGPQTALDALKQGLDTIGVPYEIQDSDWGPYIQSINGEAAATFGGWDGWLFMVNGAMAPVGAGAYQVEADDSLIFYYGEFPPTTLFSEVTINPAQPMAGQAIEVKVTSSYYDWTAEETVQVNVADASVSFRDQVYLTGADGVALIPGTDTTAAGTYTLKVSKEVAGSFPALVRTGNLPVVITEAAVPGAKTVQLRVEGINHNVFDGTVEVVSAGGPQTALDALKQGLDTIGVPYEIQDSDWGPYIQSINGEAAATFGGWDGWLFMVNGAMAPVGAGAYQLEAEDSLIFYYGEFPPTTLFPEVTINPDQPLAGQAIEVKVTSSYYDWKAEETVQVNVVDASVSFKDQVYLTGADGVALIPGTDTTPAGTYTLKVSKEVAGSFPALVRTGNLPIVITGGGGGGGGGGTPAADEYTVNIAVVGNNGALLFGPGTVVVSKTGKWGLTALGALHATGLSYTDDGGFVKSIAGQVNSGLSGWMYKVNNTVPNTVASDHRVYQGDRVIWWYSTDPNSSGPTWDSLGGVNPGQGTPVATEDAIKGATELQSKIIDGSLMPSEAVDEINKLMSRIKNDLASPSMKAADASKTLRFIMDNTLSALINSSNVTPAQAVAALRSIVNEGIKTVLARSDAGEVAEELKNSLAAQVGNIITKTGTIPASQMEVSSTSTTTTVNLSAGMLKQRLEQVGQVQKELLDILSGNQLTDVALLARTPIQNLVVDLTGLAERKETIELKIADDAARNLRGSGLKLVVMIDDGFTITLSGKERAGRPATAAIRPVMLAARGDSLHLLTFQNETESIAAEGYMLSVSRLEAAKATRLVQDAKEHSTPLVTLRPVGKAYAVAIKDLNNKNVTTLAEPLEFKLSYRGLTKNPELTGIYRYQDGKFVFAGAKTNRLHELISAGVVTGGTFTLLEYDKSFSDLAGHWAEADIRLLSAKHIVGGVSESSFGPGQTATRAQCAALLVRSLNLPESKAALNFTDVPEGAWYAGDVAAAAGAGIIKGTSAGTFSPDKHITRAELAVMISRIIEGEQGLKEPEANKVLAEYTDAGKIPAWARAGMALAAETGIIRGRTAETIVPEGIINRAEVAVIIGRLLEEID